MTESIKFSRPYPKSVVKLGRWQTYLVIGLVANAAIWTSVLLYLQFKKPTYTSTWAVTLPGSVSDTTISLPNIGQAISQSSSPYSVATQDPRENYKFIAQSESVLKAAAAQLSVPLVKFGKPRIKLADSTTIMEFSLTGVSPEEARDKAYALYKAIQSRLNVLRAQEAIQRDQGFRSALSSSQRKLEIAQNRLSDFKARSLLNSNDQIKALSNNIEQLRERRAELIAEQQQSGGRLSELSANLKLSAKQAGEAFSLQTDQIFQQNLKSYSDSSAALVTLNSKFGPEYPALVSEKAKQSAAQIALLTRGQSLLGRSISLENLEQLNLSSSTNPSAGRESLFQELIKVQADQRGLQAQAQGISQQITQLESRLRSLAQQGSTLDALNRDVQVAEAVFSSTLARLDVGRSNTFGSYPLIQMLAEPSFSRIPTSPNKTFILIGAVLGSLLVNSGLVSLWLRKRRILIEKERRLENLEYPQQSPGFVERSVESTFHGMIVPTVQRHEIDAKERKM